jgi:DNA repair protein RecN (Recombination protein N)
VGRLDTALAALDRALSEATEAQAQLEAAQAALEFDPARLEKVEERLFALRAAARKHNVTVPALASLAQRFGAQLAALDDGEAGLKRLAGEAKAARGAYLAATEAQSAARRKGAARLDKAVAAELGPLKLEKAKFVTDLAPLAMPSGPKPAPIACSSPSPPIPERRRRRLRASPRAASCRASCWH